MAGIGFALKKLSERDDYTGVISAYAYSSIISTGPWLLTILSLSLIVIFTRHFAGWEIIQNFRSIVIYNFSFSLVFTAPVYMVSTRFFADKIFQQDVTIAPSLLLGCIILINFILFPVAFAFYAIYSTMTEGAIFCAIVNFLLISGIWVTMVFLTTLKNFRAISIMFFIGVILAAVASAVGAYYYDLTGMLLGFNIGLTFIYFSFLSQIIAEFPYRFQNPLRLLRYLFIYARLAIAGVLYNSAVWVDKWIMWFAPEAERHGNGLITYPTYDTAMFLAFLTVVPAFAFFVFGLETNFYESYTHLFRGVRENASYKTIAHFHKNTMDKMYENSRNLVILQGSLSLVVILLAPTFFSWLDLNFLQISIFRLGTLGTFFNVMLLFITIFFGYFDAWTQVIWVTGIYLVTNIIGTLLTLKLGFIFYGYGYAFSSIFSFAIAALLFNAYIHKAPYHIFISNNIKRQPTT